MKCQTLLTNQLFNIIKGRNSIVLFYEEIWMLSEESLNLFAFQLHCSMDVKLDKF